MNKTKFARGTLIKKIQDSKIMGCIPVVVDKFSASIKF